jgi:phosphoribosylformylglycinamidine synthase
MGQIVAAIEGMAEACRALDFPVVSGNVSLYNETSGVGIPPTPTVGAVGLLPDYTKRARYGGLRGSHVLLLIGDWGLHLGASLYLREIHGREDGAPPPVDLVKERRNGDFVREQIRKPGTAIRGVHDLSDGGLMIAACEMALANDAGLEINLMESEPEDFPPTAWLFGEDQGRYLLAVDQYAESALSLLLSDAEAAGVPALEVGWLHRSGPDADLVRGFSESGIFDFTLPLARLREANEAWLPAYMGETA